MNENYANPVLPGFHSDPSVCKVGEDFYLVTSTFEYFPGLPLFHSRNLVDWEPVGHALQRSDQLDLTKTPSSQGIFAPTLRHHDGHFYIVCTDVCGLGNFLIRSERITGPWSHPLPLAIAGIDPSLFFHENRTWLTVSAPDQGGIHLVEMDLATGRLVGEPRLIWKGTGGKFPEGPHLYHHRGWFYLLISEGGTEFGHMLTVARSRDLQGPYASCPHNPILSHRSTDHPLQATGHADWVCLDSGAWWMVFLANRPYGYPPVHHLGRETCLAPFDWNEEDWPVVTSPLPLQLPRPDLPGSGNAEPAPTREKFDRPNLALHWNFRRNPRPDAWSLSHRPGTLSLRCARPSLDDPEPLAWIGRRQQHFHCRVETQFVFDPAGPGEAAGLVIHMNESHYASLAVTLVQGQRRVQMRRRLASMRMEGEAYPLPPGPVTLRIVTDNRTWKNNLWRLEAMLAEGWREIGLVESRHLSTEMAGGFTGVYFGLWASGHGVDSNTWAHFSWFDYEPFPDDEHLSHAYLPNPSALPGLFS